MVREAALETARECGFQLIRKLNHQKKKVVGRLDITNEIRRSEQETGQAIVVLKLADDLGLQVEAIDSVESTLPSVPSSQLVCPG